MKPLNTYQDFLQKRAIDIIKKKAKE